MAQIPQVLSTLMSSLTLEGLPASCAPGDRIDLRITPALESPKPGELPAALADLFEPEILAVLDLDPGPLVDWLVASLGVQSWAKAVEFDQPVTAPPGDLDDPSPVRGALPHLVPGTTPALKASPNVKGLVGGLSVTRDERAAEVNRVRGTISKPGLVGQVTLPTVTVTILDEKGEPLVDGVGFFKSGALVPSLVFLPVVVGSAVQQPTVRRTVTVKVSLEYTPPGPNPAAVPVERTFGPLPIDVATVEVPTVAILTRHPLVPDVAPRDIFVGVPATSRLGSLADTVDSVGHLRAVLANVETVLKAFGMLVIPPAIAEPIRVLTMLAGLAGTVHFKKGDVVSLWEFFEDWRWIMSAALVLGPSTRPVDFIAHQPPWGVVPIGRFRLYAGALGVGFVPDLNVTPISAATTVGTAVDEEPLPSGTYDNRITVVQFGTT